MNLVTPAQCRAARGLLDLSREALAEQAGVSPEALAAFEAEREAPAEAVSRIGAALEAAGVVFLGEGSGEGVGLRLARGSARSEGLTPAELNSANDD